MGMKIAIRMDDITPDMDWENFNFFLGLCEEVNAMPLLGIVPDNKDEGLRYGGAREDFFELMKALRKKDCVLAMHGCHHVYTTKRGGLFPLNKFSEFAGLAYEEQKKLLSRGKSELEKGGIETDIFMAPAHSYDKNTLKALFELGFRKITDGFGKRPYTFEGLTFYPISFRLRSSLKKKSGVTTMVIHANTANEADKEWYKNIFMEYGKNMIPYSEYLNIPPVKRRPAGRLAERLAARAKRMLVKAGSR